MSRDFNKSLTVYRKNCINLLALLAFMFKGLTKEVEAMMEQIDASVAFCILLLWSVPVYAALYIMGINRSDLLKKVCAIVIVVGFVAIIIIGTSLIKIPDDAIGINQNNDWYEPGVYFILPFSVDLRLLPITGSFEANAGIEVNYSLSPQEAESLGRDFTQKIKSQTMIQQTVINENYSSTRSITEIISLPKGVDPSHIQIMAKYTPFLFGKF